MNKSDNQPTAMLITSHCVSIMLYLSKKPNNMKSGLQRQTIIDLFQFRECAMLIRINELKWVFFSNIC